MVYVDSLFRALGRTKEIQRIGAKNNYLWCHMWSDSPNELHTMAKKLGMKREWFQKHKLLPHYDLTPKRREKAIKLGAVEYSVRKYLKDKENI